MAGGSGNTYKLAVEFATTAHVATLVLPAAYDVIQIQIHQTVAAGAGDLLLIQGLDEDDDTITFPGGAGAGGAFAIDTDDNLLQFTWKGPRIKLTYTEVTAGLNATVKIKTFMENVGDVDNMSTYQTLSASTALADVIRTLKG
tara:strand:- start:98 stop:526 length:429 start_codon:yes stop_codon:yes gene_type:complete